jgi:hypothetical protein
MLYLLVHIPTEGGVSRGGASLGARPHFILETKKEQGEWIFEKQFVHCICNYLNKEGSSIKMC